MRSNPLSYLLDPEGDEDKLLDMSGGGEVSPPEPGTDDGNKIADPTPDQPGGLNRPTAQPSDQPDAVPNQQVDPLPPPPQHIDPSENTRTQEASPGSTSSPSDPRAELEQKLLAEASRGPQTASSTQSDPRLESTKPAWYQSIAPPRQKSQIGTDIVKTVLGSLLGANRAEKRHATIAGLSGLVDHIRTKDTDQASADLDTAGKQAQMYRTLNPVSKSSATKGGDTLGALNYLLHKDQYKSAEEKAKAAKEQAAREASPDSEESRNYAKGLISSGAATFEQVKGLSKTDLQAQAARFGQSAQRDWSGPEADRRLNNREAVHMGQEERGETYKLAKEAREQGQRDVEGTIQGYDFATGHAPDRTAIEKGKALASSLATARQAAQKLGDLSQKINVATRTGTLYDVFGSDEEQKKLKAEAALWSEQLDNANRVIGQYGAPQGVELERMRTFNPKATSIQGMFSGPYLWDAAKGVYDDVEKTQMPLLGYKVPGQESAQTTLATDKPATEALPQFNKPARQMYHKRGEDTSPVPTTTEKLPTTTSNKAGAPSNSYTAQDQGNGNFLITKPGGKGSFKRVMTPDEIDAFIVAGGKLL